MANISRHQQSIYLDKDKAKLLDMLAKKTKRTKQLLLREAVDLLLEKHAESLKVVKRKP